jgi:hypothetical protein
MKKTIVSLSLMLTVGLSAAFATDEPGINQKVKESFQKEFAGAQLLGWTDLGEYQKATFILGGHRTEAYFHTDGELAASVRDLFYNQLPLAVMKSVDKKYSQAEIVDVREISNDEGTHYKLTVELRNKKYKLSVNTAGDITDKTEIK